MIVLTYSKLSDVVKKRKWIFHYWQLKTATGVNRNSWSIPRSYLEFDHEEPKYAFAFRILGLELSIFTGMKDRVCLEKNSKRT